MPPIDATQEPCDRDALLLAVILMAGLFAIVPRWAFGEELPPVPDASAPVVERMKSGFVIAPEARFTEVDGDYGTLAGVHAGFMVDRTLLIGAGGYWLADGDGREMAYGGALVEWALRGDRALGVSARALIGGGSATLDAPAGTFEPPLARHDRRDPWMRTGSGAYGHAFTARLHDDFFVFEPQLAALWNIRSGVRLGAGVGYRFVASADRLEDRLRGVSGTLSLQIGGGF